MVQNTRFGGIFKRKTPFDAEFPKTKNPGEGIKKELHSHAKNLGQI
jgi:hypothetical protein